jgi:methylmalonyl-CoA mutase
VAKGNKKPAVFLLTIGNPAMRKARATFALNFFACAGYEIIDNPGFKTGEEGIKAALSSGAEIIVICSSDEEYPALVPVICPAIKSKNKNIKVIVAGYPKEIIDALKAAGTDDFIHVRTDVVEFLKDMQNNLGIM